MGEDYSIGTIQTVSGGFMITQKYIKTSIKILKAGMPLSKLYWHIFCCPMWQNLTHLVLKAGKNTLQIFPIAV